MNVFTRGMELFDKGYRFNLRISQEAGCGDVYIHPDGTVIQLSPKDTCDGVDEQKWDSLQEYQA